MATREELVKALEDAQANFEHPLGPDWDMDDRRWAYEAMSRAKYRLAQFDRG